MRAALGARPLTDLGRNPARYNVGTLRLGAGPCRARFIEHLGDFPRPAGHPEQLSPATVNKALDQLVGLGRVKEITGGQRHRLFAYERVLKILAEGTAP